MFPACTRICLWWWLSDAVLLAAPVHAFTGIESGLLLFEQFNQQLGRPADPSVTTDDAPTQSTASSEAWLEVKSGAYATIAVPPRLSSTSGTISFWARPLWKESSDQSHPLLSMRWDDSRLGYLVLSHGWWEPAGAGRLYFILNNQESIHCSTPRSMKPDAWTMVTATWTSGSRGFCRLYLDGDQVAENRRAFSGGAEPSGPLYLGSDLGSTDRRNRTAHFLIDDLALFERGLSDREVFAAYANHQKAASFTGEEKWRWLDDGLKLPREPRRDPEGRILENRVIFDEDLRWAQSKEATITILDRIKAAGFNVYVPCVWHGNGTYYPSPLAQPDPRLVPLIATGHDPLSFLIDQAHRRGIEVHPWFTVMKRETDWRPGWYDDGTPEGAYNVHNPDFRRFIVDLMLDIVRRYDVDGVNLDYIRTMGICSSPGCRADYERVTGASYWPDYALRAVNGSARERIQRWQDEAVADIVKSFSSQAKRIRPGLVLSVDGHPHVRQAVRPLEGRDEVRWVNAGWVDVVFNMDYRPVIDVLNADAVRRELIRPESMIVLFGNYDRRDGVAIARDGARVAKYAEFARRRWPSSGIAFYLYNRLSDEQVRALKDGPFREEALPAWSLSPAQAHRNGERVDPGP